MRLASNSSIVDLRLMCCPQHRAVRLVNKPYKHAVGELLLVYLARALHNHRCAVYATRLSSRRLP